MEARENKVEVYDYKKGVKDGIPIALGYLPVSIAFGIYGVQMKLGFWITQVINALVYSGSGQFAVLNTIEGSQEIAIFSCALLLFVTQFRYALLSMSLSQKLGSSMGTFKRFLFGMFNTDEIFVVAMRKRGELEAPYLFGVATAPYISWIAGCLLGSFFTNLIPPSVNSALGIIISAMFIAMIVPSAKKSRPMLFATLIAVALSVALECSPIAQYIAKSWLLIICAVATALICAVLFPVSGEDETDKVEVKEGAE